MKWFSFAFHSAHASCVLQFSGRVIDISAGEPMASAEIAEGMVKVYAAKRGLPEALGSGWVVILRPHLKWIFLLRDAPNFMKRGGMAAVVKHQGLSRSWSSSSLLCKRL